jgi:hypothetical protein
LQGVSALEELSVLDSERSLAVQVALSLLPTNAATLQNVYLRCAVTAEELAHLARISRLRRLDLVGELPPSASIHTMAEQLTKTIDTLPSMPFAHLTGTAVAGPAKKIFAMLRLLTVADTTALSTVTTTKTMATATTPTSTCCPCDYVNLRFTDKTSVDLAAIAAAYGMSDVEGDTSGNHGASTASIRPRTLLPLTTLHLEFPVMRKVLARHLLALEQLPPTLRLLDIDTCKPFGHAMTPTTGLTDADFIKLVARQPHLDSLRFMLAAPQLTVAALAGLGASCRRLRSLCVAGAFELEKLALPAPTTTPAAAAAAVGTNTNNSSSNSSSGSGGGGGDDDAFLFPELRMLVLGGTRPDHDFSLVAPSQAHRPMALLCTRAQGRVREQLQQGDERAGRRTLTHILRLALRLAKLHLIDGHDGHGVSGVINRLWRQIHPDGSPSVICQNQVG